MSKLEHLKNSNPQPPPTANVRVEMFIDDLQDLIRLGFETGVPNGAIASALADEEYNVRVANQRLRELLAEAVDFKALSSSPIKLFITATNVHTGSGHVFRNAEITPDVLMASGCLPTMFQAVEIDGEFYWDGGYAGNPTMTPLVRDCQSHDTILVQINPIKRPTVPRTARDILDRLNEVAFNAPLLKELRMIALLHKVADPGHGEGALWAKMRIHRIASDAMLELSATSKMMSEWPFLCELRDFGRAAAQSFLDAHADDLGKTSTLDLDAMLETL